MIFKTNILHYLIKHWKGLTLLVICLFFLKLSSYAQAYFFKNFSLEEGLIQSQVYTICQDKNGNLWIGTLGGISKYNGKQFESISTNDGLIDNSVTSIIEDKQGNVWVGTWTGISIITCANEFALNCSTTFVNLTDKHGLSHYKINIIYEDSKGDIWIGTDDGLTQISTNEQTKSDINFLANKKLTNYTTLSGLSSKKVLSILEDKKGNLWTGTDSGLCMYMPKESGNFMFKKIEFSNYTINCGINKIIEDEKGKIWFATQQGVFSYNPYNQLLTHVTANNAFNNVVITDVLESKRGELFFSTESQGFYKYVSEIFEQYSTENGLKNNDIRVLFEDRESNLWIGTNSSGIFRYSNKRFESINTEFGLTDNKIWSIFEDEFENLWFGTYGGGVTMYSPKEKTFNTYTSKNGLSGNRVYAIIKDKKNNMWFGTENGVSVLKGVHSQTVLNNPSFVIYRSNNGLADNKVYSILQDTDENIWIATRGGLSKYSSKIISENKFKNYYKENGLADNIVRHIFQDGQENLWFATNNGISKLVSVSDKDEISFENITKKDGLIGNTMISITEDIAHNLWFASYAGGISRYDPKTKNIINFSTDEGLSSDNVVLLTTDSENNLWLGTNEGISKLDIHQLNISGNAFFKHYDKLEGFTGIETNQNAVFKSQSGMLWFGTVNGAIRYNPAEDKLNIVKPIIQIKGLRLFYQTVSLTDKANFNYEQNHITFDYIGICLTIPEKVKYQYMLEGFDAEWSPVTDATFATYSNLSPGNYQFKVIACNNDDLWNTVPAVYIFQITAPIWRKTWFYNISALLFILLIYILVKYRIRRIEKLNRTLEDEVALRTNQLYSQKKKLEYAYLDLAKEKETSEHLAYLVENAQYDMIFVLNNDGIILESNTLAKNFFGYSEKEISSLNLKELLVFQDPLEWENIINSISEFNNWRGEMKGKTKENNEFFLEMTLSKSEEKSNLKGNMICFIRDISARKSIEALLNSNHAKTTALIKAIPDLIFRVDCNGTLIDYKSFDETQLLVSNSKKNEIPNNISELFSASITSIFLSYINQTIVSKEMCFFECQLPTKKGNIDYEVRAVVSDKDKNEVLFILRDISKRKEAEKELQKLSLVASKTNNAILISDKEGKIEWVNNAFTKMSEYNVEEVIGNTPQILRNKEENLVSFRKSLQKCIDKQEPLVYEVLNYTKSGKPYWVLSNTSPVFDDDGNFKYFVVIDIEITEQKLAEKKLRKYAAELERSNQELQAFAYVASHDLKEPLRKVMTYSDRIITKYKSKFDENGQHYFERMRASTLRMQALIEALLNYSRVSTQANEFEKTDLKEIIQIIVADLEIQIKDTGGKVLFDKLPVIKADKLQMRQLFQNLISNSLKFHKPNVPPVVQILYNDKIKKNHIITVKDNGIGFDEKHNEKIFKPFQRLHHQTEYEGSGIGLAICDKIIQRHQGTITVKSNPDEGAQFIISLPNTIND